MLLITLLATLTLAQQSDKVALNTGAIRVPLLLEKLSKATGTTYRSTAALDDEVLFVHVKNQTPEALAKHIADVCHGEWEKKGDTFWLNKSAVRNDQDRKAEAAALGEAFKAAFAAETRVDNDSLWTPANAPARIADMRKQIIDRTSRTKTDMAYGTPMGRLFRTIIGSLDFQRLLELPAGQSFSYSTKPTAMQSSLPASARDALAVFLKEYGAVRSAASPPSDEPDMADQMLGFYLGTEYKSEPKLPATVFMRFIRTNEDRIHFKMTVLDGDGYRVAMYQTPFYLEQKTPLLDLPGSSEWLKTKVDPSPEGEALREEFQDRGSHDGPIAGADRPDQNEILGFLANPPLRTLAEKSGQDVIARLPDVIARDLFRAPHQAATLQSELTAMSTDLRFEVRNGAIEGTPTQSYRTYETRTKRAELTKLLMKTAKSLPTLDDVAAYVATQRDQTATTSFEFVAFCANDITPESAPALRCLEDSSQDSRLQLRLYASLSPQQRQAMQEQQGIPVGTLGPKQIEGLNALICRVQGYVPRNYETGSDPIRGDRVTLGEPTFVFPSGIPSGARFRLKIAATPCIQIRSEKGDCHMMSTGEFAQDLAQLEKLPNPREGQRLTGHITPANRNLYVFTLQLEGSSISEYTLTDNSLAGSEVATWQALPDPWKKGIAQLLKYFQAGPNGDGGGE